MPEPDVDSIRRDCIENPREFHWTGSTILALLDALATAREENERLEQRYEAEEVRFEMFNADIHEAEATITQLRGERLAEMVEHAEKHASGEWPLSPTQGCGALVYARRALASLDPKNPERSGAPGEPRAPSAGGGSDS